jgi:serine/threonine protein kinase/Tol biopolymer transport system component
MSVLPYCPSTDRLHSLIDGSLPDEERTDLTEHLDGCERCQQALEEMACDGTSLLHVCRASCERPPSASAYWSALRRVEGQLPEPTLLLTPPNGTPSASGEVRLDFLRPSDHPEFLGRLGHFHILDVIGRGGMGVVLRALDKCLQRLVAIKVLSPDLANNETARKRFCREARAAAAVTHENVVSIHEVDEDEESGVPFLVMHLVTGMSLEDHISANGALKPRDIISIAAQSAAGLAAAHAQGLIHRDIKPGNILLESDLQRIKITDFGLARTTEDVRLTQTGYTPGTPLYMAPEQARGEPVDHRSDLFSLGSVIYAMCTGRPPFQGSTPYVVLKSVTEERPPPIHVINPEIPEWLVEVVDRLHAKQPDDRFQSAQVLAELLGRRLAELVSGQAPKDCPKMRRVSIFATAKRRTLLALAGGILLGSAAALGATEILGASHLFGFRHPANVEESGPAPLSTLNAQVGPVWSSSFSPDGSTLVMGLDDGTVKVWDVKESKVNYTLSAHKGPVWSANVSPDGKLLATASDDGTVKIWDLSSHEIDRERLVLSHTNPVRSVVFSPDGKSVLTGSRGGNLHIYDIDPASPTYKSATFEVTRAHDGVITSVAFSPDGKHLASAGSDKLVKLWDVKERREQLHLSGHGGSVYTVAFSPDGKHLASGSWDRTVRVWDTAEGTCTAVLNGHTQDVWSVAFAPDGRTLASGSEDRTVKVWDAESGKNLATFRGHGATIYTVTFARDGKVLASGGRDGTVKLWDLSRQ